MHLGPRWTIVDTKAIGQAVGGWSQGSVLAAMGLGDAGVPGWMAVLGGTFHAQVPAVTT